MQSQQPHKSLSKQLVQTYRHLHKIPQIGLQEHKTTAFIIDFLSKIDGVLFMHRQVQTQLKTGCIAIIRSLHPQNQAYLFRADIDALNFKEQTDLEYCSKNGLHHACGHDAHTSILLHAAKEIAKRRNQLKRDIIFCFQPGEQGKQGAFKLIEQYPSLFKNVKHCFGLHVGNHRPADLLLVPSQYITANSNRFTIQIYGKSTHVMLPHLAVDANFIGCQVINQIYAVKSRLVDPANGMTIAVTQIQGGTSNPTSISDKMRIVGSVRSFNKVDHQRVIEHITKFTENICALNQAKCKVEFTRSMYRAVKNQQPAVDIVRKAGKQIFSKIQDCRPSAAGQDFCEFSQRKPSCYFVLAAGLPQSTNPITFQSKYPIHSPKFRLDENALFRGVLLWENIAFSES